MRVEDLHVTEGSLIPAPPPKANSWRHPVWLHPVCWLRLGSRTLCFIATLLCYSFIPDNFTNYAQLYSPLCPMCTQLLRDSSDRVGALSRSSNDMWTPSPRAYYPSSDMSLCKSQTLRSSC